MLILRNLSKMGIWPIVFPNVGPKRQIEEALYMPVIQIKVTKWGDWGHHLQLTSKKVSKMHQAPPPRIINVCACAKQ